MSEQDFQQPVVRAAPALYRPRYPERTIFYQLVRDHFEQFVLVHEERFEASDGPLRPVVRKVVHQFLSRGLLENGFARVRCPQCKAEFFCALSCQVRNFCSSCQLKRAVLFAEKLREEILAPVHHRHFIITASFPMASSYPAGSSCRCLSTIRSSSDCSPRPFGGWCSMNWSRPTG